MKQWPKKPLTLSQWEPSHHLLLQPSILQRLFQERIFSQPSCVGEGMWKQLPHGSPPALISTVLQRNNTEKPPAGLFHSTSDGISRGCSWCYLGDTHPRGAQLGTGPPPPLLASHSAVSSRVGRAEQMAGRWRAARCRTGALQPHHAGWAPGQSQQAELSKYLQPHPGQRRGLHRGGNSLTR